MSFKMRLMQYVRSSTVLDLRADLGYSAPKPRTKRSEHAEGRTRR